MSIITFAHFRDPDNFAFKIERAMNCSLCNKEGLWFDARVFSGINEIDCICDNCLAEGKLKVLEIETNEALEETIEEKETISYRTPALPTWQDSRLWPYIDGQYCIFERMASKEDFNDQEEFQNSFSLDDKENSDLNWLWKTLPENRVTNYLGGNDVSVYLFTYGNRKYCTWDAN